MQIVVKGRGFAVSEEVREQVTRRFEKVAKQVSDLAQLEIELSEQRGPDGCVAEATLHLKGVTLRAKDASPDMGRSVNLVADELAVQVKRNRDKRRARRESRAASAAAATPPPPAA